MERFIELARQAADHEPTPDEAIELLLCMIAGQYGIPPEKMRQAMAAHPSADRSQRDEIDPPPQTVTPPQP